ncbi:hypothetical protein [Halobacillus sp. B23F22_1]|uniref:hypothetical protein n=1 Tax=Halobacillus sp. B23F22_1 TaxID=3459514 RepID=UPI00373E432A
MERRMEERDTVVNQRRGYAEPSINNRRIGKTVLYDIYAEPDKLISPIDQKR